MADIQVTAEYGDIKKLDAELKKVAASSKILQTQFQKTDASLQTFQKTSIENVRGLNQYGQVFNGTGKNLNRFNMQLQQVGYQVGDFAVQIQGGTNAMVALGQQGSQLLSVFGGAAGALAGAGLAIATSFLAPLLKSTGATRTFADALKDAMAAADEFSKALDEVDGSFSNFNSRLEEVGRLQTAVKLQELSTAARNLNQELSEMYDGNAWLNVSRAEDLYRGLELSRKGIDAVISGLNNLKSAGTLEDQAAAATRLRQDFERFTPSINNMSAAQFEYYQKLLQTEEALLRLADVQDKQLSKYDDLLGSEEGLAAAVEANNQLYDDRLKKMQAIANTYVDIIGSEAGLTAAMNALTEMTSVGDSGFAGGRGGDPRQFTSMDEFRTQLTKTYKKPKGGGGGKKSPAEQLDEYMRKQQALAELQQRQIGMTEEQARVEELKTKYIEANVPLEMDRIEKLAATEEALRKATQAEQQRKSLMDSISGHIEAGFMAMVDGSMSVENAFKSMLRNIILEIYRQQVAKPAASFITSLFSANGNVFSNGSHIQAYANGGVIGGPTYFPMSGGKTGLMGEAGPEAIMPLKRGANGRLGVEMTGSGQVVVNNNFNISANGDDSVKRIVQQQIPRITEATKAAVVDSKRRGGSYGRAFG